MQTTNGSRRKTSQPALAVVSATEGHVAAMRAIEDVSTVIRLKRGDKLDLGPDRAKLVYVVRSGYLILQRNSLLATASPWRFTRPVVFCGAAICPHGVLWQPWRQRRVKFCVRANTPSIA